MSKKIHLNIGGMTCINCQNKIEKELRSKKGVINVKVNYAKGTADIEFDEEKNSEKRLIGVIEKLDYKVLSDSEKSPLGIAGSAGLLLIIAGLFYLIQSLGLLNMLVPDRLAETGMGYGMLFVIGLMTSVHCIAMCGGIGVSQSLTQKDAQTFMRPLAYNLGRVCSYTLIGLILGTAGSILGGNAGIGILPLIQGLFKIIAGLLMVVMGINMLGIFPGLRRFDLHPPAALGRFIGKRSAAASGPFVVGLLNGLMPCGPLQAMWLVALSAASPVKGALSMFFFSLGTVPLMMGLGSFVSLLGKKFTDKVMKAGAVIVAVMGLAILSQGVNLSGLTSHLHMGSLAFDDREGQEQQIVTGVETVSDAGTEAASDEDVTTGDEQQAEEVQIVNSTLVPGRYPDITVKAGVPVRWTIDAPESSLNGCNAVMMIQDYDIVHQFEPGENVIEFTPGESGLIRYSCWMGMVYGSINVED